MPIDPSIVVTLAKTELQADEGTNKIIVISLVLILSVILIIIF